jgi:hypothetical protein
MEIINQCFFSEPRPAQPSPAQPSPAQPSPAQPSPAQPSPAQPSPALLGPRSPGCLPAPHQGPNSEEQAGTRASEHRQQQNVPNAKKSF